MAIIIPISGKAESGKDLTAMLLRIELQKQGKKVLIINYADLLKFYCQKYFGWNGEKDEYGRTLLQNIGTKKVRAKNNNFWVDRVIDFAIIFEENYDYILIPDCRFKNEVERWDENNFDYVSLRIERLNYNNSLTAEQQLHISEIALDDYKFDYYIKAKNKEKLEQEVSKFMEYLKERFND